MLLNFLTAQFTCCHYSYSCGGIYNQDSITIISSKEELLNKFCCSNNAEPIPEFVPPPPLIRINKTPMIEINNTSSEKDGAMWFVMWILFTALIIEIVVLINI